MNQVKIEVKAQKTDVTILGNLCKNSFENHVLPESVSSPILLSAVFTPLSGSEDCFSIPPSCETHESSLWLIGYGSPAVISCYAEELNLLFNGIEDGTDVPPPSSLKEFEALKKDLDSKMEFAELLGVDLLTYVRDICAVQNPSEDVCFAMPLTYTKENHPAASPLFNTFQRQDELTDDAAKRLFSSIFDRDVVILADGEGRPEAMDKMAIFFD